MGFLFSYIYISIKTREKKNKFVKKINDQKLVMIRREKKQIAKND